MQTYNYEEINSRIMDVPDSIVNEFWKAVAAFIAVITGMALAYFKKVHTRVFQWLIVAQGIQIAWRGGMVNDVLDDLAKYSGAIYVHIILYKNGKEVNHNHKNKMRVLWERTGSVCAGCTSKCINVPSTSSHVRKVKNQWGGMKESEGIEISEDWLKVMKETIRIDGGINNVSLEDLGEVSQSIWNRLSITTYKEAHIKSIGKHFHFALGLSFCARFGEYDKSEGMMHLAARQLKEVL